MSVSVVVDDREPPAVVAAVRAHPDVESVEVRRLDAGDVAVGAVGVERKTSADYLRSALGPGGSDLRSQVGKLRAAYAHPYVLVEGDLADLETRRSGVPAASVRGSMASITARLGVPPVPSPTGRLRPDRRYPGRRRARGPRRGRHGVADRPRPRQRLYAALARRPSR